MISAAEALDRLRQGNQRYLSGTPDAPSTVTAQRRESLLGGQSPFAVVLGCADSRVPVGTIFDQGLGDLFVIRVAGNIATPPQIGSVEYAVAHLGTRLVVVLGHARCGAVAATLQQVREPSELPAALGSIVDEIRPAVEDLATADGDPEEVLQRAVRANVRAVAQRLRIASPPLAQHIETGGLRVVGADYSLKSGAVDFFDGVPV